jgi:dTDP-6-deoxy-L-talose 4-dehydrogenase (NAD+)
VKILLTGATGFIGGNLIPVLLENGHEVTAVSRSRERAESYSWFKSVQYFSYDILNVSQNIPSEFFEHDALIHLAWSGLPNYKELFHIERNLLADYFFIKSLVMGGLSNILITGTCLEYGLQNGCLSEKTPTLPSVPYGIAKDCLRRFLEQLTSHIYFNLCWVRLFYMYGEGQSPNSLLSQLDKAIENGDETFPMSGGEQLRDYLSIEEVVSNLAFLAGHVRSGGIVNCCSGKPISVRRLVEDRIRERKAKISLALGYYPYAPHEPMAFWGDCTRLNQMKSNLM